MKKRIGIVLAVLLCIGLVFTFVACNSDPIPGVTKAQIAEKEATVESYLKNWLKSNAEEEYVNQSSALKEALEAQDSFSFTDKSKHTVKPSYSVNYDAAKKQYTVTVSWNKGAVKKTYKLAAQKAVYTNWAGKASKTSDYELIEDDYAASDILDSIIEAMANTVNEITSQSVTGKFSADGIIGIDVMGYSYGLRIMGNIDTSDASKTEVGIVLVNENKETLGGLYYQGAESPKDSKVYIQYGTGKDNSGNRTYGYKYLNYADILGYLEGILETKDEPGTGIFENEDGDNQVESLGDLLTFLKIKNASMITGIVDMVAQGYEDGDHYLIDINLGSVMTEIVDMIADFGINQETLPDILTDIGLDLSTMHGLRGHISIAATLPESGKLTDFELAVNIPEDTTFYLSADEKKGVSIPIPSIGFALYLNDFNFYPDRTLDVIPEIPQDLGYFSPTNLDVSGDVYINTKENGKDTLDSTFSFRFVTDINPLEIIENLYESNARAALVITQYPGKCFTDAQKAAATKASNFLTISYEQKDRLLCVSGTAFGIKDKDGNIDDKQVYTFEMTDKAKAFALIDEWIGYSNYQGWKWDDEKGYVLIYKEDGSTIAQPALKAILESTLGQNLSKYYAEKKAEAETASAEFSFDDIGSYFDAIKGLFESLMADDVMDFDSEKGSAFIHVTPDVINKVTAAINTTFKANLPTDIDDPEYVNLDFNTEKYTDQLYITVKYGGITYVAIFDGSQEGRFDITFTMTLKSGRVYSVVFNGVDDESGNSWTASVFVKIKNAQGTEEDSTEVSLANFSLTWGDDTSSVVTSLIPDAEAKAKAGSIFEKEGPATKLVEGLISILDNENFEPTLEKIGQFIIRQIVKQ